MIVEFESPDSMEDSFRYVAKIYIGAIYIGVLLSKISIIALPKNINFFITAPIEIFLIDVLWTIRIGE